MRTTSHLPHQWSLLVLILASFTAQSAWADQAFPAQTNMSITTPNGQSRTVPLKLNGQARCVWGLFRIKLYDAALYLERTSRDVHTVIHSQQHKQLALVFLRKLSRKQLSNAYQAAFEANIREGEEGSQADLDQLHQHLMDVKKGDTLLFNIVPGQGLTVILNNQILVQINNENFGHVFLNMHLGPHPPTKELKQGLVGLKP